MRTTAILLLSAFGVLASCAATGGADPARPPFQYLEAVGSHIDTRHAIPLRVRTGTAFRATAVSNREAVFGGHPYQVSLAALISPDGAVMVHAERAADSSGASNYDNLPAADWPDARFRLRSMCAVIDRATIAEEHDLAFLDRNGWNPEGALALEQYLATTSDHNQEVVVSLVVRVPSCEDDATVAARLRRLRGQVGAAALR